MPRLFAVPAEIFGRTLSCNVPWKATGMADRHIWTISSKMPWTLTVVAQITSRPAWTTAAVPVSPVWRVTVRGAFSTHPPVPRRRASAAHRQPFLLNLLPPSSHQTVNTTRPNHKITTTHPASFLPSFLGYGSPAGKRTTEETLRVRRTPAEVSGGKPRRRR